MTRPIVALLLLALWLGAAVLVAAVVAPAAFAVLPTRTLAGALVGRVLPVIFYSGILVGAAVSILGWPSLGPGGRTAGLLLALASGVAQLLIAPRIHALQARLGVPMAALDPADPRRHAFAQLHGMSVAMMGIGGAAATVAIVLLVRLTLRSVP